MSDQAYAVPAEWAAHAKVDARRYDALYRASIDESDAFWLDQARRLDWLSFPTKADESSFHKESFGIRWFADGHLNVATNCLDRHLASRGNAPAIIWEPDDPTEASRTITYLELYEQVCRLANVLKAHGVTKGDRVTISMPMIPEAAVALLACARIGAIHSVVFGGFSPEALAGRIEDCGSKVVITADEGRRGGKPVPLKANVDAACKHAPVVETVIVVAATGANVAMQEGRDFDFATELAKVSVDCPAVPMASNDPLFILYTSGSTGKPKGVIHGSGGYLLWAAFTHETVFDYRPGQIYWCAADIGWVTGHSYIVYGPLANGGTTLMYEGVPNWPDSSRIWQVVDRHKVEILYTAPTALRALMRDGDEFVNATSRKSLKLLGTVGEPINPEACRWYYDAVGQKRCPIVDTWWQTETGGHMITPLPGATALKPGSATLPFFGVEPRLLDAEGQVLEGAAEGNLVISRSWPGQMLGVWGDEDRFFQTYFTIYSGVYTTGDGARRDADGYWWITGRVDDVINVSGHRMGTAEVESALVLHAKVAEAAVVGFPHEIKGQGIYAYVTLNADAAPSPELRNELRAWVREEIGPIATPDAIQFAPGLPKTRSGKIMRRILRKVAEGDVSSLGDTSTLADPSVVDDLIANRVS